MTRRESELRKKKKHEINLENYDTLPWERKLSINRKMLENEEITNAKI